MTLTQWRSTPAAIKTAKRIIKDEGFIQMMEVVKSELPTNRSLPLMGSAGTDFAYAYGCEIGYRNCLAILGALAQPIEKQEEVAPDFSEENNEE